MLDRDSLQRLYVSHGYLVHRRCRQILGSAADVEDAFQEVFVHIARHKNLPRPDAELAWLYRIASNVCFDLLRSRRREISEEPAQLAELDQRRQGEPGDGDRRALLGAVLRKMDSTSRDIGVLHYLDGFTQEEVACKTRYSRKTVGRKLALFEEAFRRFWTAGTA